MKILEQAGYEVNNLNHEDCLSLNKAFFHKAKFKKPFVRAKIAMSSDHKSVFVSGKRKWITGEPARKDVQFLRAEADIIVTGAGTINGDKPSMNVRQKKIVSNKNFIQPSRYVFSKNLSLDWTAPFFHLPGKKVVVTNKKKLPKFPTKLKDISIMNCSLKKNHLDPANFIQRLSKENINNIFIESGPTLLGSFGDKNLIDEYVFYISPERLGDKASYFYGGQKKLNFFESKQFDIVDEIDIGKDKKIVLRKK